MTTRLVEVPVDGAPLPLEPGIQQRVGRAKRWGPLPFVVAGACIAFIWLAVAAHSVPYFPIDLQVTRALQSVNAPWLLAVFRGFNAFGFAPIVTIAFACVVLALLLAGRRWEGVCAGIATLGAAGLTELVKGIVGRPRPLAELVDVAHQIPSHGFPAGHVMNFTPFVGFLCYLVYVRLAPSWRRTAMMMLLLAMIAVMGPARVFDGEHWPSDVLGSYLLGFVWLAIMVSLYEWGRRRAR